MNTPKKSLWPNWEPVFYVGIVALKMVENQKAYVKGWLERLESDPEWIVKASKDAFDGMQKVLGQELNK